MKRKNSKRFGPTATAYTPPPPVEELVTEEGFPLPPIQLLPPAAATNVSTTPIISWQNGGGATSYDVRFGTTNPPPLVVNQAGTTYSPGTLIPGTTYYSRIDAKNAKGTT